MTAEALGRVLGPLGFLIEIAFADGTRLELRDLHLRPQPDSLFAQP